MLYFSSSFILSFFLLHVAWGRDIPIGQSIYYEDTDTDYSLVTFAFLEINNSTDLLPDHTLVPKFLDNAGDPGQAFVTTLEFAGVGLDGDENVQRVCAFITPIIIL